MTSNITIANRYHYNKPNHTNARTKSSYSSIAVFKIGSLYARNVYIVAI
jgi:hypothetical protein